MLETGDKIPNLSFTLGDGSTARFSDYAGR